jgi:hypothetical protein
MPRSVNRPLALLLSTRPKRTGSPHRALKVAHFVLVRIIWMFWEAPLSLCRGSSQAHDCSAPLSPISSQLSAGLTGYRKLRAAGVDPPDMRNGVRNGKGNTRRLTHALLKIVPWGSCLDHPQSEDCGLRLWLGARRGADVGSLAAFPIPPRVG